MGKADWCGSLLLLFHQLIAFVLKLYNAKSIFSPKWELEDGELFMGIGRLMVRKMQYEKLTPVHHHLTH